MYLNYIGKFFEALALGRVLVQADCVEATHKTSETAVPSFTLWIHERHPELKILY